MENSYFVKTVVGSFVMVTFKEFNTFIEILDMMHPDYGVIWTDKTLCGHTYKVKHFYVNDEEVATYITDPDYIPFS